MVHYANYLCEIGFGCAGSIRDLTRTRRRWNPFPLFLFLLLFPAILRVAPPTDTSYLLILHCWCFVLSRSSMLHHPSKDSNLNNSISHVLPTHSALHDSFPRPSLSLDSSERTWGQDRRPEVSLNRYASRGTVEGHVLPRHTRRAHCP